MDEKKREKLVELANNIYRRWAKTKPVDHPDMVKFRAKAREAGILITDIDQTRIIRP